MMKIKNIAVVLFVALFCVFGAVSAKEAPKESLGGKNARNSWDEKHGINYEEDRVGSCVLPDPLVNPHNGFRASNAVEWIEKIRPAVVEEVEKLYGPALPRPLQMRFEVEESGEAFSGKAIRKQIRIYLKGDTGKEFSFGVLMYAPKAKGPLPAFVNMNFYGNHTVADDPSIIVGKYWIKDGTINGYKVRGHSPSDVVRGIHATSHPIGAILDAGFAYLTFCYCEAFPDTGEAAINSKNISAIFSDSVYPHKRAAISVWSWAISRVMDYIESQPLLDKTRIAVVGHSRQGKTALLTGALDTRFAMVISNGSGCMGAKLSRRNYGENISSITDRFGYWFSDNLKKYAFAEGKMPIDQHQLLALIAPRPVYVESASEDRWADPKGQISALVAANPVYGLFGAKDLPTMANENVPFCGATGYHLRKGKHALTEEDWEYFIKFARKHFCDKRSDGNRHSNRKVGSSHPLQPCGSFSVKPGKCTQPLSNVLRCVLNKNGKRIWRASFLPKSTIPLHCSAYGNKMIFSWRCKPGIITMILDSNDYEIVDIILHFGLSEDDPVMQSPSGRYLLFKKFSPRMSPPPVASDFIMVYDLKKTPKENRMRGDFDKDSPVSVKNAEVGKFLYPENDKVSNLNFGPYFTFVESSKEQISLYSTGWNKQNKLAIVSQKSRLGEHKFVVLCERSGCIVKKIYDLKDAELYGADNIEVEYRPGMSFFMGHFEVRDCALYIHNKAEHPAFVCAIFKTNI